MAKAPDSYEVSYHRDAVRELMDWRDKKAVKKVFTAVDILRQTGPRSVEPHSKPIKGTKKLRELRPGGGQSTIRPVYLQVDTRRFEVLAIAPEAREDPSGFEAAVDRAKQRAEATHGIDA